MTGPMLALLCLLGGDVPTSLEEAGKAFDRGDYAAAAATYDRFVSTGNVDGVVFLNQGNAHLLAGQLPDAILAYRRAERLIPNDPRLRANLADARGRVLDPPAPTTADWAPWMPRVALHQQLQWALILYAIAWVPLTLRIWRQDSWTVVAGGLVVVVSLAWLAGIHSAEDQDRRFPLAVVASDQTVLRQGNGNSYPAAEKNGVPIVLNRGVELRVQHRRKNGWLQVSLGDGALGWVPEKNVLQDRQ